MLAGIVAHLKSASIWNAVELAEDLDIVGNMIGRVEDAAVIVMPYRERAESQSLATGGFRQRIGVQFLTVIVLREYDHGMGGDRATRFDTLKHQLEQQLAGWEPPGCIHPCELVDGESSAFDRGVSFYVHTWQTARFLTGA